MSGIRAIWEKWRSSLWFVPGLIVLGCVLLALLLVELHTWVQVELSQTWPRLFGGAADGARSMLSAIATSMVTVAGVVFSVTLVALSLASSQYSPSVLRNFMNDRPTQTVLGTFVGIFAYCLVVLRTVRGDDAGGFLPSIAVLGGVVLALVGVAVLIYFIHHVAVAIQAPTIVSRIASETTQAVDRLFPEPLGEPVPDGHRLGERLPSQWCPVASTATGYLVGVQEDGLLAFAARCTRVVRLPHRVGDFVVEGRPLAEVSGAEPLPDDAAAELRKLVIVERERTVWQDAPYGLQQLVDVAVKALSPGINDPSTALICLDYLCAVLVRLAGRRFPGPYRGEEGTLRVVAHGPDFGDLVSLAFLQVIHYGRDSRHVLERVVLALETIADATRDPARRRALARVLAVVVEAAVGGIDATSQREALLARARSLQLRLPVAAVASAEAGAGPCAPA